MEKYFSPASKSKSSLYEQIEELIICNIVKGKLQVGELLPSIRSLSKSTGVSVITVQKTYSELKKKGYIESIKGKGTFVSYSNLEQIKRDAIAGHVYNMKSQAELLGISNDELMDIINIIMSSDEEERVF